MHIVFDISPCESPPTAVNVKLRDFLMEHCVRESFAYLQYIQKRKYTKNAMLLEKS